MSPWISYLIYKGHQGFDSKELEGNHRPSLKEMSSWDVYVYNILEDGGKGRGREAEKMGGEKEGGGRGGLKR